tara:strand:+ start:1081 stop:1551 length:471 start_codon:yes stop_codon:yes gene_type:complete
MPNYQSRDEIENDENAKGGAMEVLNMYGANQIVKPKEVEKEEKNGLLGGMLSDIMESKKPHRAMVRAILQMKPKDIHIIKRASKYFLDNPTELKQEVEEGIIEDLSKTKNSNDLADMIESDFEYSNGGELDGDSLIEGLAVLLDSIPNIQKTLNQN